MAFSRPLSRKEIPGLTFIFSLPEPATSMKDFRDEAPCSLWKPKKEAILNQAGQPILLSDGMIAGRIVYEQGPLVITFGELKRACMINADTTLKFGIPYEVRLALPMGLDDPDSVAEKDLWRVGWMTYPDMSKRKEPKGLRSKYGYYLLAKRVAQTPLILETKEKAGQHEFVGAERVKWSDRFRKFA